MIILLAESILHLHIYERGSMHDSVRRWSLATCYRTDWNQALYLEHVRIPAGSGYLRMSRYLGRNVVIWSSETTMTTADRHVVKEACYKHCHDHRHGPDVAG